MVLRVSVVGSGCVLCAIHDVSIVIHGLGGHSAYHEASNYLTSPVSPCHQQSGVPNLCPSPATTSRPFQTICPIASGLQGKLGRNLEKVYKRSGCFVQVYLVPLTVIALQMAALSSVILMSMAAMVAGMSDHVPKEACKSMFPIGHGVDAQVSDPPYVFTLPTSASPNSEVSVVLSGSSSSDMFKGFFVKAFDDTTGSPIGSFKAPKTIDCDGPASGAHHAGPTPKESVELMWLPPLDYTGSVSFMATVVASKEKFWTGVVSHNVIIG